MRTDYGTTYNSYVVKGEQKTALIETCHKTYFDQYLNNIREVVEPEKIDYIILNHCEPDHSGALAELLAVCKNAEILVSRAGSIYLKNITNRTDLKMRAVKDGEEIDLGGKTLKFINAPFLHWPDSMFTWEAQSGTLFSCDMFGSHYCEPHTFDTNIVYPEKYQYALKGYYDAIFGPFKPYVLEGMSKIEGLSLERLCTSHGPILTKRLPDGAGDGAIPLLEPAGGQGEEEHPGVLLLCLWKYGQDCRGYRGRHWSSAARCRLPELRCERL